MTTSPHDDARRNGRKNAKARCGSAHDDVVHATLTTPNGSAGATADAVKAALEKKTNRPVELIEKADPSIIGGAILEYGDERIDLSMRGALDRAASALIGSTD